MSVDDLRRRLGIDTDNQQPTPAGSGTVPLRDGETAGPVESNAEAVHEAKRAQWVAEAERLHLAGDDADGLEGIRALFRRTGRG